MITSIQGDTLLSDLTSFSGVTEVEGDLFSEQVLLLGSKRTTGLEPCLAVSTDFMGGKILWAESRADLN